MSSALSGSTTGPEATGASFVPITSMVSVAAAATPPSPVARKVKTSLPRCPTARAAAWSAR